MEAVVIAGAVRTPIGRYLGALKDVTTYELGALVLNEAVKRAGVDPATVDEVIMGQSYQNGESVNIARMSLLAAGWPVGIPGITLERRCCSGLDAVCCHENSKRLCRYRGCRRGRKHEPDGILYSRRIHEMGSGRTSRSQMGIYGQGARVAFHVGNSLV